MNLFLIILIPFLGALSMFMVPKQAAYRVSFLIALINFVLSIYSIVIFSPSQPNQLDIPWIPSLGISFSLYADGLGWLLILLTNTLLPVIILTSPSVIENRNNLFFGMTLLMQAALNGVFLAYDGFLFYIFWELALIPIWFICAIWGGANRINITLKFFIYTFTGSVFMLVALIYLYLQTPGTHSFNLNDLYNVALNHENAKWVFWFLFVGFAIKMPVFPFHTWQPDTYTVAPTQGTMLLSGIMLKMGIYGVMRWLLPMVPEMKDAVLFPVILAVIGVVYAAIIAITQNDLKKIIAYSSISHVGLIAAGIFTTGIHGLEGAVLQMFSHGINIVGLFFAIDLIEKKTGTRLIEALGGLASSAPKLAVLFFILVLGAMSVPLTNGFPGEFLLLSAVFNYNLYLSIIAGLTIVFCAVYMLRIFQLAMMGPPNPNFTVTDIQGKEFYILSTLALVVLIMGFFPQILLYLAEPSLNEIFELIHP